jgi:hypothetical protein
MYWATATVETSGRCQRDAIEEGGSTVARRDLASCELEAAAEGFVGFVGCALKTPDFRVLRT